VELFKSNELANVLWAWAVIGLPASHQALNLLMHRAVIISHELGDNDRAQLHQLLLHRRSGGVGVDTKQASGSALSELAIACHAAYEQQSHVTTVSAFQRDVARTLLKAGARVEEEVVLRDMGISVDMRLGGCGSRVLLEVDGPSHFIRTRTVGVDEAASEARGLRTNGSTLLKHKLLEGSGWTVLHVPYFDWEPFGSESKLKTAYVQKLLKKDLGDELMS
jgi:hypothetical protein